MRWLAAAVVLLVAPAASAHTGSTGEPLWDFDLWFVIPLCATATLFLFGTVNLWRAAGIGRGVRLDQQCVFWSGWLILFLTIVSPLHWLGERLFTAHMVEHGFLMLVAPPLIAYARPSGVMIWGLPSIWRRPVGAVFAGGFVAALWAVFGNPMVATVAQGIALWSWHAPVLFDWALESEGAHRLEHLCFFFSALLFWWSLLHGRGPGRGERARDGINIGCLFVTILHSGLLGALLTLSPHVWYPVQVHVSASFGLSPLEDQQLAGVVMWVPMGILYTGAALYFAYRWLSSAQGHSGGAADRNRARPSGILSA
jgi:putative membrane protein